ncbi:peptidase domain-containing ABC transporter [Sphingomonas sp. DT-207]|uniref:peptidase domain-containing ABC transporter n=1 Tax=Sphingomonas sp. DT-207 TaxID=3396167 RepID=UPI003F1ABB67
MASFGEVWRLPRSQALPLILQVEPAECGLACVCMVAGFHGHETSLAAARVSNATTLRGSTLQDLVDIAASYRLGARAIRCEADELHQLQMPAILHWEMKHFVVLKEVTPKGIIIHDPANGARLADRSEVSRSFTGVALELTPTGEFAPARDTKRLRLGSLVRLDQGVKSAFGQAAILSATIEFFVIATPFFMQLVIDEVILKGDLGLLTILGLAFLLITMFRAIATLIRSLTFQYISNALAYDMRARLFRRLVRLPAAFLQRRNVGDVQQRFAALDPIKQFLGGGALLAMFDGLFSIVVGILMMVYATDLALIVFGATVLYTMIRLLAVRISRRRAGDAMRAKAREQSKFLETLRAFGTIKSLGIEPRREMLYRNVAGETLSAEARLGNITFGMQALNQAIFGGVGVLVVLIAAPQVMSGEMTVGVLTAFIAYMTLFTQRIGTLIEQIVAYRLLDVQLDFVSDIALADEEEGLDDSPPVAELRGAVTLRNARFRYARRDREILAGASLAIEPGEFVAIAGASGAGKSTVLRILAGLQELNSGEVRIDDIPLHKWGKRALRRQIGVVMQDDQLLTGSIAENIALFDAEYRYEDLLRAAQLACVDEDILGLPMGFHSLVGDLGSTLSGGQKQRIMLARALYNKPRILILDEGTSHVDVATERRINTMLRDLSITRIVAAHRPETLAAADRILLIAKGQLRPQSAIMNAGELGARSGAGQVAAGSSIISTPRGWRKRDAPGRAS